MADLHETRIPEPKAQIDQVGWLFVIGVVAIAAIAVPAVDYNGNDILIAHAGVTPPR